MTPEDLIAELEQAQEGSRELSDKALLAAGWERQVDTASGGKLIYWRGPGSHWISEGSWLPSPTENLQDALGLVPEGWNVTLEIANFQNAAWLRKVDHPMCSDYGTHRPPALALTIAALKALQEET